MPPPWGHPGQAAQLQPSCRQLRNGLTHGRRHRCVTSVVTLQYQRALVVIVECLYRSYKPTRPTAAQPTPAMTQSNWIHAVGGGGNKHIRKHPKHRRPPDPTAEPEARDREVSRRQCRQAQTPKRLPFWYARFPSLGKPLPCFTSQAKHAKAQPNRERESSKSKSIPWCPHHGATQGKQPSCRQLRSGLTAWP